MQIHIARDGKQFGPFPLEEVRRQLAAGTLLPTDFAWTEGAAGWVPLASFPGLTSDSGTAAAAAGLASPPGHVAPKLEALRSSPISTSAAAISSLVFGILSYILCPFVGPIVAIVCGHVGRGNIRSSNGALGGDGMAIAGLILGYLNLVLTVPVLIGIALPVFSEVQLKGSETKSLSNAKQIETACQLYAIDNHDAFPKTLEELVPDYLPDRAILASPLSPGEAVAYHYFGGTTKDAPDKILLMSKFQDKHGKRIIVHVDGSGVVQRPPPDSLPLGEH